MLYLKEIVLCSTILLLWTVAPAEPRVANELSAEIENEYDIEETDTEAVSHANKSGCQCMPFGSIHAP